VFQTALLPSAGSVDVAINPPPLAATQSVVVGHEIAEKPGGGPPTPDLVFQAAAPPVGSVEVITSPPPSTATHNRSDGHEMPRSWYGCVSTPVVTRHAREGSVEVITSPEASIATHSAADGHETPCANAGGEGLGSGSIVPKLPHASGAGESASAAAPDDAITPTIANTVRTAIRATADAIALVNPCPVTGTHSPAPTSLPPHSSFRVPVCAGTAAEETHPGCTGRHPGRRGTKAPHRSTAVAHRL
jgi:hypothetical protein